MGDEHGLLDHFELRTIVSYVAAIGGKVEIVADFGDERVVYRARPRSCAHCSRGNGIQGVRIADDHDKVQASQCRSGH